MRLIIEYEHFFINKNSINKIKLTLFELKIIFYLVLVFYIYT